MYGNKAQNLWFSNLVLIPSNFSDYWKMYPIADKQATIDFDSCERELV